jgi:hypothetical protein
MFREKDLSNLIGSSDDGFRSNFDNTLTRLVEEGDKRRVRRPGLSIVVTIIVICTLALIGAAYAISQGNWLFMTKVEEIKINEGLVMMAVSKDDYINVSGFSLPWVIYNNIENTVSIQRFDPETAHMLQKLLADKVFAADGGPIDLIFFDLETGEYYFDDGGNTLYDEYGSELSDIYYQYHFRDSGGEMMSEGEMRVGVTTRVYRESIQKMVEPGETITSDYDEAARILTKDFRLPAVYVEGLEAPVFTVYDMALMADLISNNVFVDVLFKGEPGITFRVEFFRDRDEEERLHVRPPAYYIESAAEQWVIEETGTIVYIVRFLNDFIVSGVATQYIEFIWEHDGLLYRLVQMPNDENPFFSDEQLKDIIYSMIR